MKSAKTKILVDKMSGIAHNQVMIIDGQKVITDSYNFTAGVKKSKCRECSIDS